MSRRDERLSIMLTEEEKARWNYWSTFFDSNGDALLSLLDAYDDHPDDMATPASEQSE